MQKTRGAAFRTRVQVVRLYEAGLGAQRIASALGCVPATAVRVAQRFLEQGEEALLDGRRGNGELKVVVTPGQNRKCYLAGALAVNGRDLVFVRSERKNSDLFLALLAKLSRHQPGARRIHLVLDNYGIHSSYRVRVYLANHGFRFRLHFLPPFSPEHNDIERLWRELYANVTRNHRCTTIDELMRRVAWHLHRHAARLRRNSLTHKRGTHHARLAA